MLLHNADDQAKAGGPVQQLLIGHSAGNIVGQSPQASLLWINPVQRRQLKGNVADSVNMGLQALRKGRQSIRDAVGDRRPFGGLIYPPERPPCPGNPAIDDRGMPVDRQSDTLPPFF